VLMQVIDRSKAGVAEAEKSPMRRVMAH
jgi:hypothetical protein